jgi:hypothetical protein
MTRSNLQNALMKVGNYRASTKNDKAMLDGLALNTAILCDSNDKKREVRLEKPTDCEMA